MAGETRKLHAYFLTWTTYGTWLHGDPRGSADRHNAYRGADYHSSNPRWNQISRNRMTSRPFILNPCHRNIVREAIFEHASYKKWDVYKMACLSNHVHILIHAHDISPERVMNELKAYATRALRNNGISNEQKIWTRGGSTRYIHTEDSIRSVIRYIDNQ